MAHPYASLVKASQKRRMAALHAKTGKAHGSVNVDLKNNYKNAGTQREYTISGATSKPRADRYAKGGKVKKGNITNVIIAQPKGEAAPPRPVPVPIPVRPPMRPPMATPAAPAAPPVGAPIGGAPVGLPIGGAPPPGPPIGARPPGLKKGGRVSPSPVLPNKEIYHNEGRGFAVGGSVKKADGGFLRESPGKTYQGAPHSPTTSVDDAVSAHKKGGAVKKRAFGGGLGGGLGDGLGGGLGNGPFGRMRAAALASDQEAADVQYDSDQLAASYEGRPDEAGQDARTDAYIEPGGGGFDQKAADAKADTQYDSDQLAASYEDHPEDAASDPRTDAYVPQKRGGIVAKKRAGGGVKAGSGSGFGRLRESAIAAKVPAKTEA